MPSLDDMISQAFAAPKPPKDRSLDDMIGEAFGAPSGEPETRELNDWEVQESQQRQAELRGRFTSTAGTAEEDARAYAPPELSPERIASERHEPVDDSKLYARKTSLRSMPRYAGTGEEELDLLARQQLQPSVVAREQGEYYADRAYQRAEMDVAPRFSRNLQPDQQAEAYFGSRMGFEAPAPDINPVTQQPMSPQEKALYELAVKQVTRQNMMQGDAELYARADAVQRADAAANTIGNKYLPTGPREVLSGAADAGFGIGQVGVMAKDLIAGGLNRATGSEFDSDSAKYGNQVRGDMGRATMDAGKDSAVPEFVRRNFRGAISSLATSALAGGGTAAAVAGGVTSMADSYGEAQAAGLTGAKALLYAGVQGVIEAGAEKLAQGMGAGGIEDVLSGETKLASKGFLNALKQTSATGLKEAGTELPTSGAQELARTFMSEGKIRGASTLEEWTQVGLDTLAQSSMATVATHSKQIAEAAVKAGVTQDMLAQGSNSRKLLDMIPDSILPAETKRKMNQKDRVDALKILQEQAAKQPELKDDRASGRADSVGFDRAGSEFAEPIQGPNETGQTEAQTDADIAESDEEIRKNTPQVRAPVNDPFGMPNISDSQAMQEAARRILRERKQFSETGIEKQIQRAIETGVPPALAAKELQAQFAQDSVRESDNPESSGFIPSEAAEQYDQQTFPQRAADAIRQSSDEMIERAGYKQVDPKEAAQELQQDQINRVLDEVGVGKSVPQNDIETAIAEAEKGGDDTGYVQDQKEIKVKLGAKRGALLDDFEAEQQTRLKERMAGDRRVTVVNPHPVTGLLEGKWANQRLAEMGVERALGDGKKVTYVEGDFVNLGGLNNDLGQTAADNHLRAITKLFTRFVPKNADIAMTHKGGDEYGFHFVGMSEAEVRPLLEKALPAIQAYNKKHGLDKIAHTKTGKAPGTGVTYSVEEFDGKSHRSGVYKDKKGKDIQLNQAGALIFAADQKLETEKKKNGQTTERAPGPVGERRGGSGVAGAAAVQQESGRPAEADGVRSQSGLPSPKSEAGLQPEGSGKAVVGAGRKVTPQQVQQIIPGSTVEDSKNGYAVTLPDGRKLPVVFVDKVPLNRMDAKARTEEQLGKKLTKEQFNTMLNEGRIEPLAGYQNGKIILGPNATAKDLAEEVVHAYIDKGIITKEEYTVLAKQYSKMGKAPNLVEEDIAKAHQAWTGETKTAGGKIFQRVFGGEQGPPNSPNTPDSPSGEPGKPYGRPDLASPVTGEKGRAAVAGVDEAAKPQEKRSQNIERDRAKADFKANQEAMKGYIKSLPEGHAPSEYDVHLGRIVSQDAIDNAGDDIKKILEATELLQKYRFGGTEAGRAMAARKDNELGPAERNRWHLQNALFLPYGTYLGEIAKAKNAGDKGALKAAQQKWAERLAEIKNSLRIDGVNLDDPEHKMTPQEISIASGQLALIQGESSGWGDVIHEYHRNALLSAIKTLVVNIGGNLTSFGKHYFADRAVEATIGSLTRSGIKGSSLGEYPYIMRGLIGSIGQAWINSKTVWRSEVPITGSPNNITEGANLAIVGKVGKDATRFQKFTRTAGNVIRAPQRTNLATDEFVKSVIARMEVGAQAYRMAKEEGIKGKDAIAEYVKNQVDDPNSPAWHAAVEHAIELTFAKRRASLDVLLKVRNFDVGGGLKPVAFFFPFLTTPFNVTAEAIKSTPPGALLSAGKRMIENKREGRNIMDGVSARAAKGIVGAAVLYALSGMIGDEPEKDWITGAKDTAYDASNPSKDDLIKGTGRGPSSIKIGDEWISYGRVEPIGTALAMAVDTIKGYRKGDKGTSAITSMFYQLEDKTFLKTVGDIANMMLRRDKESVRRLGSNFVTGFIPNIYRGTARATEAGMPQSKAWGSSMFDPEYMKMGMERSKEGAQLDWDKIPIFDLYGREVGNRIKDGVPQTDFVFKLLAPSDRRTDRTTAFDLAIMKYNQGKKDEKDEWYPSLTVPHYDTKQGTKYMSPEQFAKYSKETGEQFATYITNFMKSSGELNDAKTKTIGGRLNEIRQAWRARNLK